MAKPTREPIADSGTKEAALEGESGDETVAGVENGHTLNAAGYEDQLKRQYSLVGLAGIALTVDNAWVALGSSISVSIRKFQRHSHKALLCLSGCGC
jgi:hypothetical protein